MRFARYFDPRQATVRIGVVAGDELVGLPSGASLVELAARGSNALQEAGEAALKARQEVVPQRDVRLLAPLLATTIRDFMTFEQHVEGGVNAIKPNSKVNPAWYVQPAFYFTNPAAVLGPNEDVAMPPGCSELDLELELAAVLGTGGTDLDLDQAAEAICGFLIMNDWSARDLQRQEVQVGLGPAKAKDFATTLGPVLVTADELSPYLRDDFLDLEMTATINGQLIGRDRSSQMAWTFPEMIAYSARGARVRPGDVFGSGTCGHGSLMEMRGRYGPDRYPYLTPGDVVEVSIEGLGSISNRVVACRQEAVPVPPARRRTWTAQESPAPSKL